LTLLQVEIFKKFRKGNLQTMNTRSLNMELKKAI